MKIIDTRDGKETFNDVLAQSLHRRAPDDSIILLFSKGFQVWLSQAEARSISMFTDNVIDISQASSFCKRPHKE